MPPLRRAAAILLPSSNFSERDPVAFTLGNTAVNNSWVATASATVTISVGANSNVVVIAHQTHATTTLSVASVTSANLTFTHRPGGTVSQINGAGGSDGGIHQEMEEWWAFNAGGALTNEVITVTSSGTPPIASLAAFEFT